MIHFWIEAIKGMCCTFPGQNPVSGENYSNENCIVICTFMKDFILIWKNGM
jgi:hypothetical protein